MSLQPGVTAERSGREKWVSLVQLRMYVPLWEPSQGPGQALCRGLRVAQTMGDPSRWLLGHGVSVAGQMARLLRAAERAAEGRGLHGGCWQQELLCAVGVDFPLPEASGQHRAAAQSRGAGTAQPSDPALCGCGAEICAQGLAKVISGQS